MSNHNKVLIAIIAYIIFLVVMGIVKIGLWY